MDYDVFLSHNSKDKPLIERLALNLQRANLKPWLDKWCLTPGGRWQEELAVGIRTSQACAVFIGPHGIGDWVHEELGVALDRAAKDRSFRLFLVLLPGVTQPFDASQLPPFLSTRTWVDLRGGIDETTGFQHLLNAIAGVPFGQQVPPPSSTDVCPYQGLQAFNEEHAAFFHGRETDIQRLTEKLKGTAFLSVMGPSGSGKSSLVRAGLLPAIRRDALPHSATWTIAVLTPTAHPLTALTAQLARLLPQQPLHTILDGLSADPRSLTLFSALALADQPASARLLCVVDQFEEVFTLCQDDAERAAFLQNLLFAASLPDSRCQVVLTMRADFYHRCAAYPDLSARIAAQQFLVSPLDLDGLRRAIEEPAWQVGLEFEHGLVETILDDVASQPGALPLLEHALLELWERRRGHLLTLEGYRQSGGVQGAIATRADSLYNQFTPQQQHIVRQALLRLTQPGEGTEDTRRRATRAELMTQGNTESSIESVIHTLIEARLLTASDDASGPQTIEVAHEALIRGWPRLRGWLDEDRAGLRVQQRLAESTQEWLHLDRDEGLLYRGARLAEAQEWRARHDDELNNREKEFLDTSAAELAREAEEERAQQQRDLEAAQRLAAIEAQRAEAAQQLVKAEQRRVGILRLFSLGMVGVVVIAIVAAAVALQQRQQSLAAQVQATQQRNAAVAAKLVADQQRQQADREKRLAISRELATSANTQLQSDPELSLLLARTAVQQQPGTTALDALRAALVESHVRLVLHTSSLVNLDAWYSPDGQHIITGGSDGTAQLWNAQTGQLQHVFYGHTGNVGALYNLDGRLIATVGFKDGTIQLWDAKTLRLLTTLRSGVSINDSAFSRDGNHLVTANTDGGVRVWSLPSGRLLRTLRPGGITNAASLSPDARRVALASNNTASVWDVRTGRRLLLLQGHTDMVTGVLYSPDGRLIATMSNDKTARLWNAHTGSLFAVLQGHTNVLYNMSFSPNSRWLATASADGTARLWNTATGAEQGFLSHTSKVFSVRFSPDSHLLVTASADGTARVWTVGLTYQVAVLRGHTDRVSYAMFSPDNHHVVTAGLDGTVRVWDINAGRVVAQLPHADGCLSHAASPFNYFMSGTYNASSSLIALVGNDCLVRVVSAASGRQVALLRGHTAAIIRTAFSPDGRYLVTGSSDYTARVWDTATWHLITVLHGQEGSINGVAFSPNGSILVTASADGSIRLWSVGSWRLLRVLRRPTPGFASATFSPDGQTLAVGGLDRTVQIWSMRSYTAVATLQGFGDTVTGVSFRPDSRMLAVSSQDGSMSLWDTSSWQRVETLHSTVQVSGVAYSPDGQLLLMASYDGTIHLWDPASAQDVGAIQGSNSGGVIAAAFSSNGQSILSITFDGSARILTCDACGSVDALLARAQAHTTRSLTALEQRTYLHVGQ